MTTVLKLGGSVVTEKGKPETVDDRALRQAAAAVGDTDGLVVVHGGGSFGHHHAAEHGVSATDGTDDATAVRAIHGAMERLNRTVVGALAGAGSPAVPVHPLSAARRDETGGLALPTRQVATMLEEGFLPVVHGDVIVHRRRGVTVLSGDELVATLASDLDADRVGVCSVEPGVYDADGEVIDRIDSFGVVADALGESGATDVTGGMAAKVRELLDVDSPAYVFGLEGLNAFVEGGEPGTRID